MKNKNLFTALIIPLFIILWQSSHTQTEDDNIRRQIKPAFDYLDNFSEGVAVFYEEGLFSGSKCEFIDRNGKVLIKPKYYYAGGFTNGLAAFPMQTIVKCTVVSGERNGIRPGLKVYGYIKGFTEMINKKV